MACQDISQALSCHNKELSKGFEIVDIFCKNAVFNIMLISQMFLCVQENK